MLQKIGSRPRHSVMARRLNFIIIPSSVSLPTTIFQAIHSSQMLSTIQRRFFVVSVTATTGSCTISFRERQIASSSWCSSFRILSAVVTPRRSIATWLETDRAVLCPSAVCSIRFRMTQVGSYRWDASPTRCCTSSALGTSMQSMPMTRSEVIGPQNSIPPASCCAPMATLPSVQSILSRLGSPAFHVKNRSGTRN